MTWFLKENKDYSCVWIQDNFLPNFNNDCLIALNMNFVFEQRLHHGEHLIWRVYHYPYPIFREAFPNHTQLSLISLDQLYLSMPQFFDPILQDQDILRFAAKSGTDIILNVYLC